MWSSSTHVTSQVLECSLVTSLQHQVSTERKSKDLTTPLSHLLSALWSSCRMLSSASVYEHQTCLICADLAFESQSSLHCQFLKVQEPNARGALTFKRDGKVRSLAWSPAAACPENACLLAVVNTGMEVCTFLERLPPQLTEQSVSVGRSAD